MKNDFDKLLDEAEDKLATWNLNEAVDALEGIADMLAKAVDSREEFIKSFGEIRGYLMIRAKLRLGIDTSPIDQDCLYNQFLKKVEKAAHERRIEQRSKIRIIT